MKHLAYFVINLKGQIVVPTNRQEWKELWSKCHLEKTFQPFCLAQGNLAASLVWYCSPFSSNPVRQNFKKKFSVLKKLV